MRLAHALFTLALATACSSVPVVVDFDPDFDFAGLETWNWLAPVATQTPSPAGEDPIAAERIRKAVESEMGGRGYALTDSGAEPDIYVVAYGSLHEEFDTEYVRNNYGYGYGTWGYGGTAQPVTYKYEEGKLVIDILSGADKRMIWSGSASARVDPDASAAKRDERVAQAVSKVLGEFPPKGK